MKTRRERIEEMLSQTETPLSAQNLCDMLDIKSRSLVYEDIEHITKSIRNKGKELLMSPASCGKCNFVFKDRKKAKRPSRCPKCRSEWILSP
ncbi:MAG: HTH domain-containing protein, partial [Candidatus Thorarchaeota archaeon]